VEQFKPRYYYFDMEEIKAYKTIDGEVFEDKADAEAHEKNEMKNIERQRIYDMNSDEITKYIRENHCEEGHEGRIDHYHEGEWGWDCENTSDNPIDKCVYEYDIADECCVFCGEPEERK
jgi:hypothetical protein